MSGGKGKVCWYCGEGLPPEVASIPFTNSVQRRMFHALYQAMGTCNPVVTYKALGNSVKRNSLQTRIGEIRTVLRVYADASPSNPRFLVHSEYRVGYFLEKRPSGS